MYQQADTVSGAYQAPGALAPSSLPTPPRGTAPVTDSGTFIDDDDSIFEADIAWLGTTGITKGCNPPVNDRFCPTVPVTRGQMAAFLVRALDL